MKKYLILLLTFVSFFVFAQNHTQPKFPGGEKKLYEFLAKNIVYPNEANKNRWQGKTLVSFYVNEDGSLSNISIQKSSWPVLDAEAIRVVSLMPKWTPATEKGKAVKEKVVLPILFNLKLRDKFSNPSASE